MKNRPGGRFGFWGYLPFFFGAAAAFAGGGSATSLRPPVMLIGVSGSGLMYLMSLA